MKNTIIKKYIPGITWFFVVLVLLCWPGNDLAKAESWMTKIYLDKWVHAGLFGVLALLFMLPVKRSSLSLRHKNKYLISILLAVSAWGLVTEYIQRYLVVGRDYDLLDWAADSVGAICAWVFIKCVPLKNT